jgi:thiamine-phosphate pyrophosphorylase
MKKGIYFVTDRNSSLHFPPDTILRSVLDAGVPWVQFRDKESSDSEFLVHLDSFLKISESYDVTTIINDRIELCKDYPVSGFHIGLSDCEPKLAKKLSGENKILGLSIEKVPNWEKYLLEQVDYFGISPIFSTPTKTDTKEGWSWDGLRMIRNRTSAPLAAIGGLKLEHVRIAIEHGADLFAVVSAFTQSENPYETAKAYVREWEKLSA